MRVALILAVMIAATPARADDREDARREFAAGQAADKLQDWQTAIEHYLRANDLVPHPFALFNIASDYERLGQLREAASWYQRYLEATPSSPERTKVEKTLADLKTRPGKLTVRTTPPGARLVLDGVPVGVTPFTGAERGGAHHIVVELGGQRDERDLAIEFGEPADVDLALDAAAPPGRAPFQGGGTLLVTGAPTGAYVTIDNIAVGVVPATVPIAAGAHVVHVESYGFVPYTAQANVAPGEVARVEVALARAQPGAVDPAAKIPFGYVLGVAGGADAQGGGAFYEAVFGVRIAQYEGVIRAGQASSGTVIDFLLRWAVIPTRIAPFIAIGYSYVGNGFGYELAAGLRWDLSRGAPLGVSLLADAGLRYYSVTDAMDDSMTTAVSYPIEVSLELVYR